MTDETNTEVKKEGEVSPSASTGGETAAKTTSPSYVTSDMLEAALGRISQLEGEVRAAQSTKDKGIAKVNSRVDKLQAEWVEKYEAYRSAGKSSQEALREMQIDDILKGEDQQNTQVQSSDGKTTDNQKPSASDVQSQIISSYGLDANSADVITALREHGNDLAKFTMSLSKVAIAKQTSQEAPANEAQILSAGGGSSSSGESRETVAAELDKYVKNPRLAETIEGKKRYKELTNKLEVLLKQQ